MIHVQRLNGIAGLYNFFNGDLITSGTGDGSAAGTSFTDASDDAFADVVVGDFLHVNGEAAPFEVTDKPDNNTLTLADSLASDHSGSRYNVRRGGMSPNDLIIQPTPAEDGTYLVGWESPNFY
jgi:hypothetical protein